MDATLAVAIVGAIAAVVSTAVAIWAVISKRRPKRLQWFVVADQSFRPEVATSAWPDLQVTYSGHTLKLARLVSVVVRNTGKETVTAKDFVSPIEVAGMGSDNFVAGAAALRPKGGYQVPVPITELTRCSVQCRPVVLNPGDMLLINVLIDGDNSEIITTAHIAGFTFSEMPDRAAEMLKVTKTSFGILRRMGGF